MLVSPASPTGKEDGLLRQPIRGLAVGLLVLVLAPAPAFARSQSERLLQRLAQIEMELHRQEWAKAERMGRRLVLDLQRVDDSSGTVAALLGRTEAWRAIALAGRSELEEAAWRWHIAGVFLPQLDGDDLVTFGEPGLRLAETLAWERREVERGSRVTGPVDRSFVAPVVARRRPVILPTGGSRQRSAGRVMVRVLVDVEGRPRAPEVLLSRGGPIALYGALDSILHWSFEPARLAGLPVPFLALVSVEIPARGPG